MNDTMKAQELRIGNWVECLSEQRQVLGITKHNGTNETARHYVEFKKIVPLKLLHIKPIPLTEDWLLKFGFEKVVYDSEETGYGTDYELEINEVGFLSYSDDFSCALFD